MQHLVFKDASKGCMALGILSVIQIVQGRAILFKTRPEHSENLCLHVIFSINAHNFAFG